MKVLNYIKIRILHKLFYAHLRQMQIYESQGERQVNLNFLAHPCYIKDSKKPPHMDDGRVRKLRLTRPPAPSDRYTELKVMPFLKCFN